MPALPGKGLAALTVSAPCEGKGESGVSRAAGVTGCCGIPRPWLTSLPPASCAGCPSSRPACWPGAPPLLSPATDSRVTGTAGSPPSLPAPWGRSIVLVRGMTSFWQPPSLARYWWGSPAHGSPTRPSLPAFRRRREEEGARGVASPCSTPQLYCMTRGGPRCPGTANATPEGSAAPPLHLPHNTQPRQAAHTATSARGRAEQHPALCQAELHHEPQRQASTAGHQAVAVP